MSERPQWADAEVLGVCAPDLVTICVWPGCRTPASVEVELAVDGRWASRQLCGAHAEAVGAGHGR